MTGNSIIYAGLTLAVVISICQVSITIILKQIITMNQQELQARLTSLSSTLTKISVEISDKFNELKKTIEEQNFVSPQVTAALSELESKVAVLDEFVPDADAEPVTDELSTTTELNAELPTPTEVDSAPVADAEIPTAPEETKNPNSEVETPLGEQIDGGSPDLGF